jgi:hypothetical protein
MSSGMGMPTTSYTADGTDNGWDEADKLGYQYSLRVACVPHIHCEDLFSITP